MRMWFSINKQKTFCFDVIWMILKICSNTLKQIGHTQKHTHTHSKLRAWVFWWHLINATMSKPLKYFNHHQKLRVIHRINGYQCAYVCVGNLSLLMTNPVVDTHIFRKRVSEWVYEWLVEIQIVWIVHCMVAAHPYIWAKFLLNPSYELSKLAPFFTFSILFGQSQKAPSEIRTAILTTTIHFQRSLVSGSMK